MNLYIKILLISLLALLLPVFLVSEGIFKDYTFAAIGLVLLFYYPIYIILVGIYSGLQMKERWKINFIFPTLFFILFFVIFRLDEDPFNYFHIGYFGTGILTMYITHFIKISIMKKKDSN